MIEEVDHLRFTPPITFYCGHRLVVNVDVDDVDVDIVVVVLFCFLLDTVARALKNAETQSTVTTVCAIRTAVTWPLTVLVPLVSMDRAQTIPSTVHRRLVD